MHTSRLARDRLEAASHYRALFRGDDTIEADAAALRINTFVESVLSFLGAMSRRGGRHG
jgi:hypothetical protein